MIICGTGHRPDKLGGYGEDVYAKLVALAYEHLIAVKPATVISGMALGWDIALADAALSMPGDIRLIAAVPFLAQQTAWPKHARDRYNRILHKAHNVKIVSDSGYAPWKMQRRNVWMVDKCDRVVALWNGSNGGTANCISYAGVRGRPVDNLWDKFKMK